MYGPVNADAPAYKPALLSNPFRSAAAAPSKRGIGTVLEPIYAPADLKSIIAIGLLTLAQYGAELYVLSESLTVQ